jgi:hypothetical protein
MFLLPFFYVCLDDEFFGGTFDACHAFFPFLDREVGAVDSYDVFHQVLLR